MTRLSEARIDLSALRHNLQRARQVAPGLAVVAVVKANAYGHGLLRCAPALSAADAFAVTHLEEVQALREAGLRQPVILLQGWLDPVCLPRLVELGVQPVVHRESQLVDLEHARFTGPLKIWVKLDTGMHRLGFPPERAAEIAARLAAIPALAWPPGWMSHLANADDLEDVTTRRQTQCFQQSIQGLGGVRSLANSAGLLAWPETHMDWVRPGILLYGGSPIPARPAIELGLRPVMELTTRLVAIQSRRGGDPVGYGGTWVCPEDMPVGVAAIGYGDGYPRHACSGTPVGVAGQRCALVGRVSMDMITVDLREAPDARVGDPVELWGRGVSADEVARHAGTLSYELFCGVTQRVRFKEVS